MSLEELEDKVEKTNIRCSTAFSKSGRYVNSTTHCNLTPISLFLGHQVAILNLVLFLVIALLSHCLLVSLLMLARNIVGVSGFRSLLYYVGRYMQIHGLKSSMM